MWMLHDSCDRSLNKLSIENGFNDELALLWFGNRETANLAALNAELFELEIAAAAAAAAADTPDGDLTFDNWFGKKFNDWCMLIYFFLLNIYV